MRTTTFFLQLLFLFFFFISGAMLLGGCTEAERRALLELKNGLTDPLDHLSSWKVGQDCCKWAGVGCRNRTNRVSRLDLRQLSLGGKIGASILALEDLSYLDLSSNSFRGTENIPSFIGSVSKLKYLNLSGSSFGGTIPPSLGNLTRLEYLDLGNCFLESKPNDLHWLSGSTSLQYLDLQAIDLSKAESYWLQKLNAFPSLRELHLSNCGLSNLHNSLTFINFTSLSYLDLSNNGFNSSLPLWLFNLSSSLLHLDLNSNNIGGTLPDAFSSLMSLEELDLSTNSFIEGDLPRSLGTLCHLRFLKLSVNQMSGTTTNFFDGLARCKNGSDLENLDLGFNSFSGNLPESLGQLKKLRLLQLSRNMFQGSVPESIGNLSSLEQFNVPQNRLSWIPTSIGQLSALDVLDLSENSLEGVLTEEHMSNLSSLRDLNLYKESGNTSLAFKISPNWLPPFKLEFLRIRSCCLGPNFPNWLRNQDKLTTLVLNNVGVEGTIPEWFMGLNLLLSEIDVAYNRLSGTPPTSLAFSNYANVDLSSNLYEGDLPLWSSNVTTLYLRDNLFSGAIPSDFGEKMPFIADLDISRNNLTGSVPSSIGEMSGLLTLVISNNYLTGEIPRFWKNVPFLYIVDMSNNSLSGPIPSEIGYLSGLRFFILSNNNLSGEIPDSLGNCSSISSLDLGDNKFSREIPKWIAEKMRSLLILRLRNNSLFGEIPREICGLSGLHIVDLSHNVLTGRIPSCVGNLTGLKIKLTEQDTQVYQGKLNVVAKGQLLQYLNTLYLVNSLDLSHNKLSGEIPGEITSLVELWTLNLSMNNLVGRIPGDFENLKGLETLDLSRNKLKGQIPPGMVSMTKLSYLDLSYNDLSGSIPTANQFHTFNDPAFYEGNLGLCGIPLPKLCSRDGETPNHGKNNSEGKDGGNDDLFEKLWLFLSIALGFIVGFWGVCGTLMINKPWRIAYYGFVDRIMNKVAVAISVGKARIRSRGGTHKEEERVRVGENGDDWQTMLSVLKPTLPKS